jgi:hypothetical protein
VALFGISWVGRIRRDEQEMVAEETGVTRGTGL